MDRFPSGRLSALARVAAFASLLVLAGCSSATSTAKGTQVGVTLDDFKIVADRAAVPAGTVVFRIDNRGPSTHELVVVQTDLPPAGLPLRADGLTIDEGSPYLHAAGEFGDLGLGDRRTLVLQLPPGHYVMFCNLEGHYLGGMYLSIGVGRGVPTG